MSTSSSLKGRQREAKIWINNAIRLEKEGHYRSAEETYTRVLFLLQGLLRDGSLSASDQQALMFYMSDVAKRIKSLRELNRRVPSQDVAASSTSQTQSAPLAVPPTVVRPSTKTPSPPDAAYLSFLDDPKYTQALRSARRGQGLGTKSPATGPVKPPPPRSSPSPGAGPAHSSLASTLPLGMGAPPAAPGLGGRGRPPAGGEANQDGLPVSPRVHHTGLANRPAPRTSERVLKAIEVATQLSQQGEIKRAVDVLQHAYTVGARERHTPGNFSRIEDMLLLMRQQYYAKYPPRFLQDNPILPIEVELLRQSGVTSTIALSIWDDVERGYGAENVFMPCEGVWQDKFTPCLGPGQVKAGAQLIHAGELYGEGTELAIVRQADPFAIRQSVVGDCSLVSSLIVCASYQKRFPKARIISNVIYPQDQGGNPVVNPKGKYCVKMLINGMTRLVTIDDRLPANPRTKQLLCTHSCDPGELWVPLMEKAFVKICGGSYDFPGSSSSSDLYKLSGWLPDVLHFRAKDFDAEFQWRRLSHSVANGAVLITIATPAELPCGIEQRLMLSSDHAYAVLDLREVKGTRVMQLRNPWSECTWTGPLSLADRSEDAMAIHQAFGYNQEQSDLGIFLLTWDAVLRYFERASLSWNPYMLYRTPEGMSSKPTRIACHGIFKYTTSMGDAPQLHISVMQAPRPTRMHLVFSRHITDVTEFRLQFDHKNPKTPFVALKVFDVTAHPSIAHHIGCVCVLGMCYCRRVVSSSDFSDYMEPLNDVVFRNAAAHTVSFDCPAGTTQMVVVVARTESPVVEPFNFTVTLHTGLELGRLRSPTSAVPLPPPEKDNNLQRANTDTGDLDRGVFMHSIPLTCLGNTASLVGSWVKGKSCGGRSDASTFIYNPQYSLNLSRAALLSARVVVSNCKESCQLLLVRRERWSPTEQPLTSFNARVGNVNKEGALVMKAKLYGYGGALLDSALPETLCVDVHQLLGKRVTKPSSKLHVTVVGATGADGESQFTLYDVDERDEASSVLLAALQRGYPASPLSSELVVLGIVCPFSTCIRDMLEQFSDSAPSATAGATPARTIDVQLKLSPESAKLRFLEGSPAAELLAELKNIVINLERRSSQMASCLPSLASIQRRATCLGPCQAPGSAQEHITVLCVFLAEYIRRARARPQSTAAVAQCLPPLPAGEYTLIPSLWNKGVPGDFAIVVEATEPVEIKPIPPEGAGLREKCINARLLEAGAALRGASEPPLALTKEDVYFRNSKARFSVQTRSVFTCRLLLLEEDTAGVEKVSCSNAITYAHVALFIARDAKVMEMIASSGSYTSEGIAIASLVLEGNVNYWVVVSSSKPATSKYVLRIYTTGLCSAELVKSI